MKGPLLSLGKPKESKDSPARSYASEAFSALKDDDEAGFVEAFLGAVRACSKKDDDEDDLTLTEE